MGNLSGEEEGARKLAAEGAEPLENFWSAGPGGGHPDWAAAGHRRAVRAASLQIST